ncbi:MAG: methionine--tRNA ligase [Nitrososphaeraceae archaeon]
MKSLIITSALPYANGEIHLGHIASTYLPADIFARYWRHLGREVYYLCATDDFGTPILINAEKESITPQQYVKTWRDSDLNDFESLDISFDYFSQTSSEENIHLTQEIFNKLCKNGHIYEKDVVQFFCEFDKKFLPDRYVVGKCPYCSSENQYSDLCENCGRVPDKILEPRCRICGNVPVKKTSTHYFFRLSTFSRQLKDWLTTNHNLQSDVTSYVLKWIDEGLVDWDITRDLSWGVPIPKAEARGQVFYGWFDNHICYISSLLSFLKKSGNNSDGREFWNNSEIFHFIGKDIVYHHYLFLPAIRMGIRNEYKLPDYIPTRGHLMLSNRKISKSRGWYIGLKDFLQLFPSDYLRFYLARVTPYSQTDTNFDWDVFIERINNELIANIGNFIHRTLSFIKATFDGSVPEPTVYDDVDLSTINRISGISDVVGTAIAKNEIENAMREILDFSSSLNRYFQKKKPWEESHSAQNTLYVSANAVQSLAILLEPFIPNSAERIWDQLGLDNNVHNQNWSRASRIDMSAYHKIGEIQPLFQKIERRKLDLDKWKVD